MGNTPPVKAVAPCRNFIEITNTQTGDVYLINVNKINQVSKNKMNVKIQVGGHGEHGDISYEIHKDCYEQILLAIQQAQGPVHLDEVK